jgi:translation initiation factor 2 subunit 3
MAEGNKLEYAIPGGLIAVGTKVDPTLTRQNKLVGHVIGDVGTLPDVYCEVEIQYNLLAQVVGLKKSGKEKSSKATKIQKLGIDESLQMNLCSLTSAATVVAVQGDIVKVALLSPVCASVGDHVAISRRVDRHWRLIGWGTVRRGVPIPVVEE